LGDEDRNCARLRDGREAGSRASACGSRFSNASATLIRARSSFERASCADVPDCNAIWIASASERRSVSARIGKLNDKDKQTMNTRKRIVEKRDRQECLSYTECPAVSRWAR